MNTMAFGLMVGRSQGSSKALREVTHFDESMLDDRFEGLFRAVRFDPYDSLTRLRGHRRLQRSRTLRD
jgi:hypothetical protein